MGLYTLTDLQRETLIELLNISVGKAADVLSQMARCEIELSVPRLLMITYREACRLASGESQGEGDLVSINMELQGSFSGQAMLLFSEQSSLALVKTILPGEVPLEVLHEMEEEALTEVGNVVLGASLSAFADLLGERIISSVPFCLRGDQEQAARDQGEAEVMFLLVNFSHQQGLQSGYVTLLFDVESVSTIIEAVDRYLRQLGLG